MLGQLSKGAEGSSALARKLAVQPPTLTNVVEGLVQRGLVERRHGDLDRRTVSYTVTDDGRSRLAHADAHVRSKLDEVASGLDDDDLVAVAYRGLELWEQALDVSRRRRAEQLRAGEVVG